MYEVIDTETARRLAVGEAMMRFSYPPSPEFVPEADAGNTKGKGGTLWLRNRQGVHH